MLTEALSGSSKQANACVCVGRHLLHGFPSLSPCPPALIRRGCAHCSAGFVLENVPLWLQAIRHPHCLVGTIYCQSQGLCCGRRWPTVFPKLTWHPTQLSTLSSFLSLFPLLPLCLSNWELSVWCNLCDVTRSLGASVSRTPTQKKTELCIKYIFSQWLYYYY